MKIKDKILSETSEETKQKIRDNANKLVMKQSAVEWLIEQLKDVKYNTLEKNGYSIALERIHKQAKEMENNTSKIRRVEEAKFRIYKDHWNVEHTQWIKSNFLNGFEAGAKWQTEISYSEEELLEFSNWCRIQDNKYPNRVITIQQLFEQFKKK